MPKEAYPGDTLEIFLDANISKYSVDEIKVFFDEVSGDIVSMGPDVLKTRVPLDFPPGNSVWVVVYTQAFKTPPARITVLPSPWFLKVTKSPLYLTLIIGLIAGTIFGLFLWWRLRKLALQKGMEGHPSVIQGQTEGVSSLGESIEAEPELEPLRVPDELVAACQKGECIVFAGADLSKSAGVPTWQEFVEGLLQWALDNKLLDPNLSISYRKNLQSGQADVVADGVARAVKDSKDPPVNDMLSRYLQDIFVRPSPQLTSVHHMMKKIGFSEAITTNLDSLLEQALEVPSIFTPRDAQELLPRLAKQEPFILKLFGILGRPETVTISLAQYRDGLADNKVFLEFVEKLFISRTVLFVGTNLDSVQSNLEALRLRNVSRSHYALVGVSGSEWRARADSLKRRFSVQVLPYSSSEGDTAIVTFLDTLANRVAVVEGAAKATSREPPLLKRIQLENIGPFERLDLRFDPRWNILLGDNGVGKSNILRAIAFALAGKHALRYADRLIKFGELSGRIVIEFSDGTANVTELYRTSTEPEIKVLQQRELVGTERWLAMGFPPLRQVGWTASKGPQPKPGTPYTTPADVLPLVIGDIDPRMTDLKQSILNFDYQSHSDNGERYKKLLDDFFDTIGQVTVGVTLRRGRIDQQTWQIFVETADGEVPLAAVSQGTQSLMGWIGLLLQRLYEVYDNVENPKEGSALVLIDEIDAHMHPLWQQTIVKTLTKLFPKVQFMATTHSPLIVGGMPVSQVFRFKRDEKRGVAIAQIDEDMTSGRADQVLTGSLFGLPTTLDSVTQEKIKEYQALLGKSARTEAEEREFQELRKVLQFRIPVPYETPSDRRALALVEALLMQQALESVPGAQTEMLKQVRDRALESAKKLLAEVQSQQEVRA
jgi:hypothetical protein